MVWDGIDKRKFPRVSFECIVKVKKERTPLLFNTQTENVSIGGVCVILEKELPKFAPVELELFLPDDIPAAKCEGRVVWSVKRGEYRKKKPLQYDTGIEVKELSSEDRKRLEHIIKELLEY